MRKFLSAALAPLLLLGAFAPSAGVAAIPYGSYINYILQVPLFWLTPMTQGILDEGLQAGMIKLFNGDWSGLWAVAAWVPRLLRFRSLPAPPPNLPAAPPPSPAPRKTAPGRP